MPEGQKKNHGEFLWCIRSLFFNILLSKTFYCYLKSCSMNIFSKFPTVNNANAHQLFASEPSHCKSPECSQDESHRRALVLRRVSGGRCSVLLFLCGHAATSPRRFSAPKRENFTKEQSKRAPRVTGVFLKMASRSCVSGCGRFLTSSVAERK